MLRNPQCKAAKTSPGSLGPTNSTPIFLQYFLKTSSMFIGLRLCLDDDMTAAAKHSKPPKESSQAATSGKIKETSRLAQWTRAPRMA